MPVPDKTIFANHWIEDRGITFGEARRITDPQEKLLCLKKRIETYIIKQVDVIGHRDNYAPFPLTVLTCIAVETLGRIIEPVSAYEKDSRKKNEIPKIVSTAIYGKLHPRINGQLSQKFKAGMKNLWPDADVKNISSYSELFHSYLRTTLIHGYRAKNVFLTEDIPEWTLDDIGCLYINPYWFWKAFKRVFEECFEKILDNSELNNPYRKNAFEYFEHLLTDEKYDKQHAIFCYAG